MKVWLLEGHEPYECSEIVGVYATEELAERKRDRLIKANQDYEAKCQEYEMLVDGLPEDAEWPDSPETPDHYCSEFVITPWRVIGPRPRKDESK